MKIYVAGSSKEIHRAESVMRTLERLGHTITFDWVSHMRKSPPDDECTEGYLRASAKADLDGISEADMFVFLSSETPSHGASFEAGFAAHYAQSARLIAVWVGPKRGPFWTLFDAIYPDVPAFFNARFP